MALSDLPQDILEFAKQNPLLTGATLTGSAIALGGAGVVVTKSRSSKKRKAKKNKRRGITRKRRKSRSRGRRTPRTAGRGRDRSTRRIRYTKNRQPYVILSSGKARFIKKSSARKSHKLKGGRY